MILFSAADFLRVLLAFLFVFLALPLIAEGHRLWRGEPFTYGAQVSAPLVLRAFVRASFAAEAAGLLLGRVKLCLPGVIIAACLVACVRGMWVARRNRLGSSEAGSQAVWNPLLSFLDDRASVSLSSQLDVFTLRSPRLSQHVRLFGCLIGLTLLAGIWTPLRQARFDHEQTYLRAVSLGALTQAQTSAPDGSVAFLAPLVSFSGLNAAPVVRFTGPILATVALLLVAFSASRIRAKSAVAVFALILFAGLLFSWANGNWELLPASVAAVYAIAAIAIAPFSLRDGVLAAVVALMIAPRAWLVLLVCGLSLLVLFALARAPIRSKPFRIASLATIVGFVALLHYQHAKGPAQVYQYESAARACEEIGRRFHRNEWLVVSPFHELACTYGQGWHVELSDFVSKFNIDQVSRSDFEFPYESQHVFFFVERRPLRVGPHLAAAGVSWHYAPAESEDWSAYLYGDPLGRASLEYRTAELLTAYGSSHSNLAVFYADENLVVFTLRHTPGT